MNNFFRKLFSTTLISCLSLSMFACGSQSTGQVAVENAGTLSSDDVLLINEEVVPKSSTPAGEEDDTRNVQKLSNMGMTLPLPEEYVNTKGFIEYQDIDLSDEGLYFATASYIGIPKEKYDEMVSGGMSAEDADYLHKNAAPVFVLFCIDYDRKAADIVKMVDEEQLLEIPLSGSNFTELKVVGDCTYYSYDFGDYPAEFGEEYKKEYDTILSLREDIFKDTAYLAPIRPHSEMIGKKLSFTTTDLDGNTITSEEIFSQHEITMVNVWATWCGYCIKELPDLEEINNRLAEKDCGIVGLMGDVDLDEETLQLGKDILKETGVTYLNILPWEGWETYIPENWPTSYFVDRDGYILTTPLKGARINVYEKRINNLLENR